MTVSKHISEMGEHPLKIFLSVIAGLIAGSHSLLHSSTTFIWTVNWQAGMDLGIACGKAFLVGGSAWAGQTVSVYWRKKILRWWRERKNKSNEK